MAAVFALTLTDMMTAAVAAAVASTIPVGIGYLLSLVMISVASCTVIVAVTGSVYC